MTEEEEEEQQQSNSYDCCDPRGQKESFDYYVAELEQIVLYKTCNKLILIDFMYFTCTAKVI